MLTQVKDAPDAAVVAVYGCLLNLVLCHQVGTIRRVFSDEVTDVHPVFKKPIRGVLVQLELADVNAAKDYVLFLGRKPLWF
jgi:hypothetical protein